MSGLAPLVRVESDGTAPGTRVLDEAGHDITRLVRSVTWRMDTERGRACVELEVDLSPALVRGHVVWRGLDDVPAAALAAELDRRGRAYVG